jgi:bifunctional enzyme Fae/Hps
MFEVKTMFAVGEALIGSGGEVAHVDLLVGDKNGPVGQAFANGMAQPSQGHTPLLAVIRPNLLTKPCTLIIPKVTVKDLEQASKVFGPAQYAVAKAIADSVEEGVIPADKLDEWVIICGVFVHPEAKDYRKIYQYNYGATKLALKRALENYPSVDKIMYEKDRAVHPIMGFRVPRLWKPPYLQVALDIPDIEHVKQVIRQIPSSDQLILEAGTPLIKKYGLRVVRELREVAGNAFIIADLKTMDVGQVEVDLAFEETADAVVVSGMASKQTIEKFIDEAKKCGIYAFLDLSNVEDPISLLKSLKEPPEVVLVHRPIDTEHEAKQRWEIIEDLKKAVDKKILVAVAGGITPENVQKVLKLGADIIVVGRYITQSRDITHAAREFLQHMGGDIDLFRVHYATE